LSLNQDTEGNQRVENQNGYVRHKFLRSFLASILLIFITLYEDERLTPPTILLA
jgi:hypothetical protein